MQCLLLTLSRTMASNSLIRTGCYSGNCFLSDENSLRIITAIKVDIFIEHPPTQGLDENQVATHRRGLFAFSNNGRVKCASSSGSVLPQRCCSPVLWHRPPQVILQLNPQLERLRSTHIR